MRSLKYLFAATIIVALASPALAQSDPHHPDAAETAPALDATDAAPLAETPDPAKTEPNATACPDMMSMMMQSGTPNSQSMMMQMMQMMQSMQMMQMQLMQQMRQMQPGMQEQLPGGEASP
ncbi:MAG: hypothetical protein ABS35_25645 [Kaistia sp. SCN 65-12]|nr:MAG: hypothetical protein ABS35_25645 [Kaistia sp. SCN 65-12]